MDFKSQIISALTKLKNGKDALVQGRNSNIEDYYNVWRGKPSWLKYNYRLPNGESVESSLLTLNAPRYFCRTWANNYANENTIITIPGDEANENLKNILDSNNLFGRFNNFCEMFMGLGIGAMVAEVEVQSDEENQIVKGNYEIKIKTVSGRRVYPITINDGVVTEVAFISYFTGGAKIIIYYLEDDHYNLATFIGKTNSTMQDSTYAFDFDNPTIIKNVSPKDIPLFQVWMPNIADEDELDNSIGTSIFSMALDTFKQLDLGYTAFYKEVKLGQKVKFVTTDIIETDDEGKKILPFNENDESVIFIKNSGEDSTKMSEFNGELRIDSLVKFINLNLNLAAMLCGLGQTQFEFDKAGGGPIQTATGVIAKQTELYRNVIKQENFATNCFKQLVRAIIWLNNTFTNNPVIKMPSMKDIQVIYDDNIVEDTASKKASELQEVQAGVMSIAEYRSHWYDEDYDSALEFIHENGLLIDKYTLALQSNVITPEMFVDFVFGETFKLKNELVAYITEKMNQPQFLSSGFEDETEDENDDDDDNKSQSQNQDENLKDNE